VSIKAEVTLDCRCYSPAHTTIVELNQSASSSYTCYV